LLFVAGRPIKGRLKRMKKSNPPERVLRLAGATGLPAHVHPVGYGCIGCEGWGKPRPLLFALSSLPTRSGVWPCDSYDV
jgi:hypothetical protein